MECATMVFAYIYLSVPFIGAQDSTHTHTHTPPHVFSVWGGFTRGCEGTSVTASSEQDTPESRF